MFEIILRYKFPVHVLTESKLTLRGLDLLKEIDKNAILSANLKSELKSGVIISFSISTLDKKLAEILQLRAPALRERSENMEKNSEESFLTGACYIPVLPFLSDTEEQLELMKTQAAAPIHIFWIALIRSLLAGVTVKAVVIFSEKLG